MLTTLRIFGFDKIQNGQIEAIIAYLNNKNTFISIKTGKGKTLCYALLAIYFADLTIIFNPLKVLMKDQKVRN